MKKGLLTIFIIVTCVFLSECKKDPKLDVFRVTEVDVDASYKTAEINGSYTFSVIPDDMKIVYGEKDDLTDAISSKVNVGESAFHVNINNLSTETKYYYCFECYSSHSSTRSEVHSFVTLKAEKPVVETGAVENITLTFATCGGNVVSDCGADVTERGVCWSTSPNPTINDNITTNGNGTGTFTSNLINLTANTTYYVRAYANNSAGTGYGNEISFTTLKDIVKPTVKTNEVSSVVQDAAIGGGVVIDDGGAEVTARGVCWSTSQNPTINGSHTDDGTGEGDFTSTITGLTAGTTYYVRAYATNEKGTSYGEEKSFMTSIYMDLPILTTKEIEDITETSATSGGEVVSDGGAPVIARGICWSTSQDPTIDDNDGMTTDGNGTGTFTSDLVNLTANTIYYVRAYATNVMGTAYGEQRSFTTEEEEAELTPPTVITSEVIDITETTAVSGGNVTDDGGATVTARGICWSTSQNPTIDDNDGITTDGNGTGTFTSNLINLTANTTYYVRAYATNEKGTSYGDEMSFTTEEEEAELTPPTVITSEVIDITETTAVSGGNVTDDGGATVTARGICWSTSQNPTIDDNDGITTDGNGTGTFTSNLINLTANTTYYVRAYATNEKGTSYGDEMSFTTEEEEAELTPPIVITSEVIDITETTAVSGGNVTDDGGATVTARGICWSISQDPTIDDNDGMTTDGNGTGTFTSDLVNLTANTTYYVRAYATNVMGTAYGEQRSFTTEEEEAELTPPTVITSEVIDITETTAVSGGNVTDDGGATVTARGICWSTSQNPTIDDNDGMTTDGNGTGTFTSDLINLTANTTYYVRAYATNEKGTSYGDEMSFTTEEEDEEGCEPDGEIAGHYYVDLGLPSGVKWATCNVGASSPEDYGDYFAWGETSPKAEYTWENSVTYGEQMSDISGNAQYDAATANWGGSWRMPTKEQMEELVDHCEWEWTQVNGVNGSRVIGPNGSCIFLPAAGRRNGSSLNFDGSNGYYWSSSPSDYGDDSAGGLYFDNGYEDVYWNYYRDNGFTVRPISE